MSGDEEEGKIVMNQWTEHEEECEKEKLRAKFQEKLNPKRKPLHNVFKLVNGLTVCAALLMAISQCIGVFFEDLGVIDYVLRLYVLLFCLLAIVNETNLFSLTRDSKVLQLWITRGAFYGFIGVLGLSENAALPVFDTQGRVKRDMALNFIVICSLAMIAVGILYTVMGFLCLQLVYNKLEDDFKERTKLSEELQKANEGYGAINQNVV